MRTRKDSIERFIKDAGRAIGHKAAAWRFYKYHETVCRFIEGTGHGMDTAMGLIAYDILFDDGVMLAELLLNIHHSEDTDTMIIDGDEIPWNGDAVRRWLHRRFIPMEDDENE